MSVFCEVITVGDEILWGQIHDTNSTYISQKLAAAGFQVVRRTSVGDTAEAITAALREAHSRADIVIMTGGLGPTKDDITKKTLCEYFNTSLELREDVLIMLQDFFSKRGREMSEAIRSQALFPQAATLLPNAWGTAPGMLFHQDGKATVSLPGVPHEMKNLLDVEAIPRLSTLYHTPAIVHKYLLTAGVGESVIAKQIETWEDALPSHLKLAYLPSVSKVLLRLTGTGADHELLSQDMDARMAEMRSIIQKYVVADKLISFEEAIGELLVSQELTVATAESCTGGYLGHMFTSVAGSSRYYLGGVVAYQNEVKEHMLGVSKNDLIDHGAVSEPVVRTMAMAIRQRTGADIGIATSGIAGPGGGTPEKPVGTVWLAVDVQGKVITRKLQLGKERALNIQQTGVLALDLMRKIILGYAE